MEMYDIKPKEEWQRVLDTVYRELGMPSAITDKKNAVLQVSGQRNPLCSKIRSIKEASAFICSQAQQFMAKETEKKKNVWARWYDRLGSFYDERFTGPNWREKQKEFWDKHLKEYSGL